MHSLSAWQATVLHSLVTKLLELPMQQAGQLSSSIVPMGKLS